MANVYGRRNENDVEKKDVSIEGFTKNPSIEALDIVKSPIHMPYYFYLARCSDNSLYCGSCKNLSHREKIHNSGKGAKYTRSRLPIHIVYSEACATLVDAMRREAEIKKWRKDKKESLAKGLPPTKD